MDASSLPAAVGAGQELVERMMPELEYRPASVDFAGVDQGARPLGMSDPRLLTVVEVAGVLGVGRSKVYELLYRGELKSVKIGSSRRVRYSDLGDFVRYLDDAS